MRGPLRPATLGLLSGALLTLLGACSRAGGGASEPHTAVRILPTNAAAVDYLIDLVGPERIAAMPSTVLEFANVPIDRAVFRGERLFSDFSAEVLLSFDPDLVVVSPWQGQDTIDRLRESGVAVIELIPVEDLDDIRACLALLGRELDAEQRAGELLADMDRRVAELERRAAARPSLRCMPYTNYGSGGWTAGKGTTADLVLELAGFVNAAAGRSGHDTLDIETLLDLDPDFLVVSKPNVTYGAAKAYLEGEAALAQLRAVQAGRIAEVPAALYSTSSHHLVGAAEALADEVERLLAE